MNSADESPAPTAIIRRPSRWWRTVALGLLLIGLVLIVFQTRHAERQRQLIASIKKSGGNVSLPAPLWWDVIYRWRGGTRQHTVVDLRGREFDDAWLQKHRYLADLTIQNLQLEDTAMTGAALAMVVRSQPLKYLEVIRSGFSDETAAALTHQQALVSLDLTGPITDRGLAVLPLENIRHLCLGRTSVTPNGLRQLERCQQLEWLRIDQAQDSPETTTWLRQLPHLKHLNIVDYAPTAEDSLNVGRLAGETASATPAVMPLSISQILQVSGIQIQEAHGGYWSLSAEDGTAVIDVYSHDGRLTKVLISIWHPGPGDFLATDLHAIQKLICQIFPADPWFAGDWYGSPPDGLSLPARVSHKDYTLTLNVEAGTTTLVLTPSQTNQELEPAAR